MRRQLINIACCTATEKHLRTQTDHSVLAVQLCNPRHSRLEYPPPAWNTHHQPGISTTSRLVAWPLSLVLGRRRKRAADSLTHSLSRRGCAQTDCCLDPSILNLDPRITSPRHSTLRCAPHELSPPFILFHFRLAHVDGANMWRRRLGGGEDMLPSSAWHRMAAMTTARPPTPMHCTCNVQLHPVGL